MRARFLRVPALVLIFAVTTAAPPSRPIPAETEQDPTVERIATLVKEGHYAEAEAAARATIESRRTAGESESIAVCSITRWLVEALYRGGKAKDPGTRELALANIDMARSLFGESHPEYAAAIGNLGNIAMQNEDFVGARTAWTQALEIREKVFGPRSVEVALTLNNLASVEGVTGNFSTCRAHMERALSIQEDVLGPDAVAVANIRHNLAVFMEKTGDWLGAVEQGERVIEIRIKGLPPDHPLTAMSTHNLAVFKYHLGDYVAAKDLYEKALAMQERSLGPEHQDVARTLGSLAGLLADMGRLEEARILYERALSILERAVTANNSLLAECRSELALLLARMGEREKARELMLGALRSQEITFGPVQQDVAMTLNGLAGLEADLGETDAARRDYERALSIYETVYSPTHPRAARSLFGLAELRLAASEFGAAESLLRRALAIRETALGVEHPDVAQVRVGLARVALGRSEPRTALREALKAEEILRGHFDRVLSGLSEREALAYERIRASGLGIALTVLTSTPARALDPTAPVQVWNALARSRALVLDRIASRHRLLAASESPEMKSRARALAAATNRLATLVVRGPEPDRPEAYRRTVSEAVAERDRIERDIVERSGGRGKGSAASPVSIEALRAALPADAALLAFVQYSAGQNVAAPTHGKTRQEIASYAAFVLRTNRARPMVFDLGHARDIETHITEWMEEAAHPRVTLPAGAAAEQRYRDAGAVIRKALWDPLAGALAGARVVFIVPDGSVNLVNFAALPVGDSGYLIEQGPLVHYLSAERDLMKHSVRRQVGNGGLVVGAPDFDATPDAIAEAAGGASTPPASRPTPARAGVYRGPTAECVDFRDLNFEPLPATLDEAAEVETLWRREFSKGTGNGAQTTRLIGFSATEAAFKEAARRQGRLHLATHGFYIVPGCRVSKAATGPARAEGDGAETRSETVLEENPLLLSGIALAGANRRNSAPRDAEDGILTAEEIASLDLSGVDWAVLSGCETALGTIQAGEGIFGLRRAFEVAGADTLIMSLWKVEDRATLEWMRRLYERRAEGASTLEAVRDAGLAMLQSRRAKGRSTHPFYWGAFVSAGDWR